MNHVLPEQRSAAGAAGKAGTMLRLHLHPGTSGLAPHMALLATGAGFETVLVNLHEGAHRQRDFLEINPFGTIPVLEDGAIIVAETGAILLHVADRFPASGLLPAQGPTRHVAIRWLFHAASIHADFMTWRRAAFAVEDAGTRAVVQDWMARRLADAFMACDKAMSGPFLAGPAVTIADLYLVMVAGWWSRRFPFAERTPRLGAGLRATAQLPYVARGYSAQETPVPIFT